MPKQPTEPRQFGPAEKPHWFIVQVGLFGDAVRPQGMEFLPDKRYVKLENRPGFLTETTTCSIRIKALNARDAHYQLSIQMEALGWIEGQNWRVTMIVPEEEK